MIKVKIKSIFNNINSREEENKDIQDSISMESFTIRARDISSNPVEENKNLELIRRLSIR